MIISSVVHIFKYVFFYSGSSNKQEKFSHAAVLIEKYGKKRNAGTWTTLSRHPSISY